MIQSINVELKTAVSVEVGFPDGFQLPAKTDEVPHLPAFATPAVVPLAVPVHVLGAANVLELNPATVPIATRASDNARVKENLDLMQNPFFG